MQLGRYLPVFFTVVAGVGIANYTFKPLLEDADHRKRESQMKDMAKPGPQKKEEGAK